MAEYVEPLPYPPNLIVDGCVNPFATDRDRERAWADFFQTLEEEKVWPYTNPEQAKRAREAAKPANNTAAVNRNRLKMLRAAEGSSTSYTPRNRVAYRDYSR
jgi:hypothetical protein